MSGIIKSLEGRTQHCAFCKVTGKPHPPAQFYVADGPGGFGLGLCNLHLAEKALELAALEARSLEPIERKFLLDGLERLKAFVENASTSLN